VDIALRKWDGYFLFSEYLVNSKTQVTVDKLYLEYIVRPEKQLKFKGAVLEVIPQVCPCDLTLDEPADPIDNQQPRQECNGSLPIQRNF
jgi:hypothetical protein